MSGAHVVIAREVSFGVPGKQIISRLSLSVRAGEVLSLVGPNGAGKSTVLGLLAGDLEPQTGGIWLDGKELSRYRAQELARRRAMALQDSRVGYAYTVAEVIGMGRLAWRGQQTEQYDEEMIRKAMLRTETEALAEREVTSLSGGELARTTLGRVIAQDTQLLLLDEPTAALDVRHQEAALSLCQDVARDGGSAVVVLHDLDLAASYSDRMILLDQGRVIQSGPPEQVCDAEVLSRVYGAAIEVFPHPTTRRPVVLPARDGRGR